MTGPAGGAPLAGRRILVTRRPEQSARLVERLAELGAIVLEAPMIEVAPPADPRPLDRALAALPDYRLVIFTSANAVRSVRSRMEALGLGAAFPAGVELASVGRATSEALLALFPGCAVALEPASDFRAEGLLEALAARELTGVKVLLPASDRARDLLPRALRERGARVDAVVAYRTVVPPGTRARVEEAVREGLDLLTFASPSAVENFAAAAGELAGGLPAAVLGPVTEQAAREAGLDVRVVASPSTTEGLVAALTRYFAEGPAPPRPSP